MSGDAETNRRVEPRRQPCGRKWPGLSMTPVYPRRWQTRQNGSVVTSAIRFWSQRISSKGDQQSDGPQRHFFALLFRLSFISVCPPASVELARPRPLLFFFAGATTDADRFQSAVNGPHRLAGRAVPALASDCSSHLLWGQFSCTSPVDASRDCSPHSSTERVIRSSI
jgi:hypothetical protein